MQVLRSLEDAERLVSHKCMLHCVLCALCFHGTSLVLEVCCQHISYLRKTPSQAVQIAKILNHVHSGNNVTM